MIYPSHNGDRDEADDLRSRPRSRRDEEQSAHPVPNDFDNCLYGFDTGSDLSTHGEPAHGPTDDFPPVTMKRVLQALQLLGLETERISSEWVHATLTEQQVLIVQVDPTAPRLKLLFDWQAPAGIAPKELRQLANDINKQCPGIVASVVGNSRQGRALIFSWGMDTSKGLSDEQLSVTFRYVFHHIDQALSYCQQRYPQPETTIQPWAAVTVEVTASDLRLLMDASRAMEVLARQRGAVLDPSSGGLTLHYPDLIVEATVDGAMVVFRTRGQRIYDKRGFAKSLTVANDCNEDETEHALVVHHLDRDRITLGVSAALAMPGKVSLAHVQDAIDGLVSWHRHCEDIAASALERYRVRGF